MSRFASPDFPRPPAGKDGWPWTQLCLDEEPPQAHGVTCPRISIVTPSFNQGEFLEETIRSVLGQDYPNLEFIIIDGGSSDDSVSIIKKYDPWISYWCSEPDRGQVHAINKGLAGATGDILAYLNSDDLLTEGTLRRVAELLGEALRVPAIATFAGIEFGQGREDLLRLPQMRPNADEWLSSELSVFQPSTFWTRRLHDELGGFNEAFAFCFDKEFFFRAIFQGHTYLAEPNWVASKFRLHEQSKTSFLGDLMWAENRAIWRAYKASYFCSNRELISALEQEKKPLHAAALTRSSFDKKRVIESMQLLVQAALANPWEVKNRFYLGAWRRTLRRCLKNGWQSSQASPEIRGK